MLTQPSTCVEAKGPFEGLNPGLCANVAQQAIADYLKDKPGWYIAKYGCQRSSTIVN